MTTATAPTSVDYDDSVFDASSYDLPIPRMDGFRATSLELRFSGAGVLDRTSTDDLELLEAARLGREIRLIVVGEVGGKGFRMRKRSDLEPDEVSYSCTVRVLSVEAAEIA